MRLLPVIMFSLFCHLLSAGEQNPLPQKTEKFRQQDNMEEFLYAYLDAFLQAPTENNLGLFRKAMEKRWRPLRNNDERLAFVVLKCNEGFYQTKYNSIVEAIPVYEEAWKTYESYNLTGFDIIEYCLKPLGNAYTMLGDYESAEQIVKSYLIEAGNSNKVEHMSSAAINLSIIYQSTGRNREAIDILSQGIDAPGLPEQKKGLFYANLARNYLALELHEKALAMAAMARDNFQEFLPWDVGAQLVNVSSTLAVVYKMAGNNDEALKAISYAMDIADTSNTVTSRMKAKVYIQKAEFLREAGKLNRSLEIYREALSILLPSNYDIGNLPKKDMLYAENSLKETFDGMAGIFTELDSLVMALNYLELSFEVEDHLRTSFNYQEATYLQQHENRERAERALLLLRRMYDEDGDNKHIQRAFEIAENTKSVVLKSTVSERQFWLFVQNDSLVERNKQLNRRKASIRNELIREQLKGKNADLAHIAQLTKQQNEVMLELRELQKEVSYNNDPGGTLTKEGIGALQKELLWRNETLMEYFVGKNYTFLFVVNGHSIELIIIDDMEELKEDVNMFLSYFTDPNGVNHDYEGFAKVALSLYEKLRFPEADSSIIIVPDGILNFIPFEALLTEIPADYNYDKWSWLLKIHNISYQTSATSILRPASQKNSGSKTVLGVFPEFENTSRYLKYTMDEARELQAYFNGRYLEKEEATKQTFLRNLEEHQIIHLCTHADAGDLYEPPSIAFIDSALYLPEIYGLTAGNMLMVLSACETGIGKLHSGESAVSLANGFMQAGVNNIVYSLWQVNDFSTSRLMANFYKHYDDSQLAHQALRKAKLDYLENSEIDLAYKSPYFWAPFVYYGNTQQEETTGILSWPSKPYLLFLIILIFILVSWRAVCIYRGRLSQ